MGDGINSRNSSRGVILMIRLTFCLYILTLYCVLPFHTEKAFADSGAMEISPVEAMAFFPDPETESTISFRVKADDASGILPEQINYNITNYAGDKIAEGKSVVDTAGSFVITYKFPRGYYELNFPEYGVSYGISCFPAYTQAVDSFFGIGTQFRWFARTADTRERRLKILKRAGVSIAREQITWASINPEKGVYKFSFENFDKTREAFLQSGLKTLDMFTDSPAWTNEVQWETNTLAYDLMSTYQSWRDISDHWKQTFGALEIHNEIDDPWGCGNTSGDQCASVHKTIRSALMRSGVNPKIGNAPFTGSVKEDYFKLLVENRMFDNCDFFSFHYYGLPMELKNSLIKYKAWLTKYDLGWMPFWITESGWPYPRNDNAQRPEKAASMLSALNITMNGVEALTYGVEGYFPFVFGYYPENNHNYSMLDAQESPLRSTAGYFQLANVLSHSTYAGEYTKEIPGILKTRCFRTKDGKAIVVYYTGVIDKTVQIQADTMKPLLVQGLDGRSIPLQPDHSFPVQDGLAYAYYSWEDIADSLVIDPEVAEIRPGEKPNVDPSADGIVLQYRVNPNASPTTLKGYYIKSLQKTPISVRIHNFTDTDQKIILTVTSDALSQPITMPAIEVLKNSYADYNQDIQLQDNAYTGEPVTVKVEARPFGKETVSDTLALWFTPEPVLPPNTKKLDLSKVELAFDVQSPGTIKLVQKNGVIVSHIDLSGTGAYPSHFPAWATTIINLEESLGDVKGIAVRMRCDGKAWGRMKFCLRNNDCFKSEDGNICVDDRWHLYYIPMKAEKMPNWRTYNPQTANGTFNASDITSIYFVLHSFSLKHRLEISAVYLVY